MVLRTVEERLPLDSAMAEYDIPFANCVSISFSLSVSPFRLTLPSGGQLDWRLTRGDPPGDEEEKLNTCRANSLAE